MEKFNVNFELKGAHESDEDEGTFGFFEGFAATFGNIDLVNDRLEPKAFANTLKEDGPQFKLLWQHDTFSPIGSIVEAKETDKGLEIKGRINLGTSQGKDAFALLKAGDIDRMSIGFSIKPELGL